MKSFHIACLVVAHGLLLAAGCGDSHDTSDAAVAKDSGSDGEGLDAATNADASTGKGGGGCDERECACDELCDKIATAGCPDDVPLDECVSGCNETAMPECGDQKTNLVVCRAQKSQVAFHCDGEFVLDGCDPEQEAYATCRGL